MDLKDCYTENHCPRLLISSESAPPYASGVSTVVNQMTKYLDNWNVLILAPDTSYSTLNDKPVVRLPSVKLPMYSGLNAVIPQRPHVRKQIKKCLDEFKPDVILTIGGAFLASTTAYLGKSRNIPIVGLNDTDFITYATHYGLGRFAGSIGRLTKWLHRSNTVTLVTSPSYHKKLDSVGFTNLRQWRLGIDIEEFSPQHRTDDLKQTVLEQYPDTQVICLIVSRLASEKSIDQLHPIAKLEGVTLVVVGDGPEYQILQEQFADTRTIFLGRKDNKKSELSQLYASADIFLCASRSETFGLTVLEATASGVPCVIADGNGIRDIVVHDKTGYICSNQAEMIRYVENLRDNPQHRSQMSAAARQEGLRYSWKIVMQELEAILLESINH
ncbi:MAG: glycosyltransferase [Anaerolineae bacterium]|nr:glycosyltransferase [Anaerolineae bacterium]MDQ7036333.1 glycosyltransferase [Anaerolineae bacterium]